MIKRIFCTYGSLVYREIVHTNTLKMLLQPLNMAGDCDVEGRKGVEKEQLEIDTRTVWEGKIYW